jgi:Major tropism determinant N-terminal domain
MAVKIQLRRGTASEWTSANPTLSAGEAGFETDTRQFKIGDGSLSWSALAYYATGTITSVTGGSGLSGSASAGSAVLTLDTTTSAGAIARAIVDNKGDLVTATADNVPASLSVGSNGYVLTANSATATGLEWALPPVTLTGSETLTNKTLTSPVVSSPSVTSGTFSSPAVSKGVLTSPIEVWNVVSGAPSTTTNIDANTSGAWLYTSNSANNWTLNVRGDGSTTLNSIMSNGQSMTVVVAVTNGGTAYRPTAFQIDGSSVTPKWQGGTAPSAGNANSVDVYAYTIVKTASATYTVFASQTKFA